MRESCFKTWHLERRSRPVGAKHSDRKSTVSPIGYCPNASPVLFQPTLSSWTKIKLTVGSGVVRQESVVGRRETGYTLRYK
ncbi:MAG: hypothetical protein EWV83_19570 [Microcystis sp. M_OC_Ca_00000000_S217Cul]|nr:MAG: hypothetical protein EWV83_19570 [Microcystis sp. M_OC_Ca_00000000_S217Cul]TRT82559.1 MAG: hypothetical protein EWV66_24755 [Microcystis sp. M_OC_Ca_00000000_C217Col]